MSKKARDKYAHPELWYASKDKYNRKYYKRTQQGWNKRTEDQIDLVLAHKYTDTQLSSMIGHSVCAIQIMRSRAKKKVIRNDKQKIHIAPVGNKHDAAYCRMQKQDR
jgi:hypothetical protein